MKIFKKSRKNIFKLNDAERAFFIFSAIYLPVSVLFIENSTLAEVILALLTLVLLMLGTLLIYSFVLELGEYFDEKYSIKLLYQRSITNAIFPLSMFKVFALVILKILPKDHSGWLCVMRDLILDLYRIFQPQDTINYLILAILGIVLLITFVEYVAKLNKRN
ncbi:MAG: hypothetical protein KatS3mg085_281 [Candidatus Dojkabacteria bacterium]|nr:MAG: hypothetical protein KatS3mg085_281 [Candidatus Dojkabacteria bacterium]GIW58901.1 MAG: hypothetical protein KatS3mg086_186 [Candidatus Dojkabacteria bacterium]